MDARDKRRLGCHDRADCSGSCLLCSRSTASVRLVWWCRTAKYSARVPRAIANPGTFSDFGSCRRISGRFGFACWTSKPDRGPRYRCGHACGAPYRSLEVWVLHELVWRPARSWNRISHPGSGSRAGGDDQGKRPILSGPNIVQTYFHSGWRRPRRRNGERTMNSITKDHGKLGFIGIGAMGSRIAGRLLKHGFSVTVFDRNTAKTNSLIESGAVM